MTFDIQPTDTPIDAKLEINKQFQFKDILDFIAIMFKHNTTFVLYNEHGDVVFNFFISVHSYDDGEKAFQLESGNTCNIKGRVSFETKGGGYVDPMGAAFEDSTVIKKVVDFSNLYSRKEGAIMMVGNKQFKSNGIGFDMIN